MQLWQLPWGKTSTNTSDERAENSIINIEVYPLVYWKLGDAMRRVVVNMQNELFCDAISETLRFSDNEFDTYTVSSADHVVEECKWLSPYALLMEVGTNAPWRLCDRIALGNAVKAKAPDCKVVLIVDENTHKAAAKDVREAKKEGLIDQFVYGSISATYLADIVDSL